MNQIGYLNYQEIIRKVDGLEPPDQTSPQRATSNKGRGRNGRRGTENKETISMKLNGRRREEGGGVSRVAGKVGMHSPKTADDFVERRLERQCFGGGMRGDARSNLIFGTVGYQSFPTKSFRKDPIMRLNISSERCIAA
jgi:hypothetical protein